MAVQPRWVESREQRVVRLLVVLRSGQVVKWLLVVGLLDPADTVRVASRQPDLLGLGPGLPVLHRLVDTPPLQRFAVTSTTGEYTTKAGTLSIQVHGSQQVLPPTPFGTHPLGQLLPAIVGTASNRRSITIMATTWSIKTTAFTSTGIAPGHPKSSTILLPI
jgi:hypothetical protein